ncbi:mucin-2-like [Trichoplusia ni]|uniref:Mucin-2-like n=1 Tax=Trichoplusia ni TaxID=7111 RepID=A0A7E5W0B8_TRINI|nr:mucin-2-like [Trichoplusia ni]
MAYIRARPLFVLTLLQLCRAEISDSLSESWYSANVINDGFQPKPISEIFSTDTPFPTNPVKPISDIFSSESPFSTANPIIVLPTSTPYPPVEASTLPPTRKISTTSTSADYTQTSTLAPTFQTEPPSSFPTTLPPSSLASTFSTYQSTPSTFQTSPVTFSTTPSTTLSSSPPPPIASQPYSIEPEIQQTTLSVPQPPRGAPQTQSQQIRLELVPQQFIPDFNRPIGIQASIPQQNSETSTGGPLSNYFLIYQQAPQNIQGLPGPVQGEAQLTTRVQDTTTRTPSTVIISPAATQTTRAAPSTSTTPVPSTVRIVSTQTPRTTQTVRNTNCQNAPNTPILSGPPYPLRIRVMAPSGSITNVHLNPASRTTTTRRPTTTRTRKIKPRKNTYDACIDGCKRGRDPICAAPLSSTFLNPDTLKGFPSICHMACHNSYRKDSYEKVLDGRCGRLRTRIKTVDSNKLKRDELNKAQYFVDNGGTIVELSALPN